MPPREAPHPWMPPSRPWSRVHLDYAGPFYGRNFLVGVDTYSRWPEVTQVSSLSATELIKHLQRMFATHGLPEVIVTDNGTTFASAEMREFMKLNGIQHVFTPVYHPAFNGSAERMVQTVKSGLSRLQGSDWECRLSRLLYFPCGPPRVPQPERHQRRSYSGVAFEFDLTCCDLLTTDNRT
ncbi:uncharacterized protein K02A2.6-like [Ornithodoros turicata]|uniref:uncharacterized protein K02A2.6-like n=1 Tax=Ornithodoros turicata TaxID=34597 RepID=UPI0031395E07